MDKQRIPGFRWAMMIFIFYIISYALPTILKDFQGKLPYKSFVFDLTYIAPFVAVFVCLIIFGSKRVQLNGLKFTLGLDTIVRLLLALIIPLVIFIVAMTSFNVFADSFILLQAEDLSVSITTVIVGQLVMAFLIEFAFRSYLQNIVENRVYNLFASIIVGFLYALWNINLSFGLTFAMYSFLYGFAFSLIVGELIRGMKGRTIYIATVFHFIMSFGLVFLFNEELGNVFAMKVVAYSTVVVGIVYLILSMIVRVILYFFTRRNFDEIEENNYMDHLNDEDEVEATKGHKTSHDNHHDKDPTTETDNRIEAQVTNVDKFERETTATEQITTSESETSPIVEDNVTSESETSPITEDTLQRNDVSVAKDASRTQDESVTQNNYIDSQVDSELDASNDIDDSRVASNTTDKQHETEHIEHSNLNQNVANDTETTSSKHLNNDAQMDNNTSNLDEAQSNEQEDSEHNGSTNEYHRTSFLTKLKNRNRR